MTPPLPRARRCGVTGLRAVLGEAAPKYLSHHEAEGVLTALTPVVDRLLAEARSWGVRLALYETGWWCGECNPARDEGCCELPARVRAALTDEAQP